MSNQILDYILMGTKDFYIDAENDMVITLGLFGGGISIYELDFENEIIRTMFNGPCDRIHRNLKKTLMYLKKTVILEDMNIQSFSSISKMDLRPHNNKWCFVKLINYFDVWGNRRDGWDVNNLCKEWTTLVHDFNSENAFKLLKDKGFFKKHIRLNMVDIYDDGDIIEFFQRKNGMTVCRLEIVEV